MTIIHLFIHQKDEEIKLHARRELSYMQKAIL